MDFWPEFLASSWGREFVAGGFGGIAGVISGYPLDTLRIMQQQSISGSASKIFRNIIANDGPAGLFRGMTAPLASVTFQVGLIMILSYLHGCFCSQTPFNGGLRFKGQILIDVFAFTERRRVSDLCRSFSGIQLLLSIQWRPSKL